MVFLTTDISGPRGDLLRSEKGVYALVFDPSPTYGNTIFVRYINTFGIGATSRSVVYNKAVFVRHLQERKDFVVTALLEANV